MTLLLQLPFEYIVFGLILSVFASASAVYAIKATKFSFAGFGMESREEEPIEIDEVSTPKNSPPFKSKVVNLKHQVFRNVDGSFTAGFKVEPAAQIYAPDEWNNELNAMIARLISLEKPEGTVLQFRTSYLPDPGVLLKGHVEYLEAITDIHEPALLLHQADLHHHFENIREGRYRHQSVTLWVRVPVKHRMDRWTSSFLVTWLILKTAFQREGVRGFRNALGMALKAGFENTFSDEGLIQRLEEIEEESREVAEDVFERIQGECPIRLKRLTDQEMWERYFLSHNEAARSVPVIEHDGLTDLREYFSSTIRFDGVGVMHDETPIAIVSMLRPPQETLSSNGPTGTYVGCMRRLYQNQSLCFPHTNILEHITLNQEKKRKSLDKRKSRLRATANKPLSAGGNAMSEEAIASTNSVTLVREEMAHGEVLGAIRHCTIVYGDPAFSDEEKKRNLRTLKLRADMVEGAYRSITGVEAKREQAAAARVLYPKLLVGEFDEQPSGREIEELNRSLSPMISLETGFKGTPEPNLFYQCVQSGEMGGLNLKRLSEVPTVGIFGETRSGKSVLAAMLHKGALASIPKARVNIIDFNSFGTFSEVMEGVRFIFSEKEPKGFNIWHFDGIERGEMPGAAQVQLVTGDLIRLARIDPNNYTMEALVSPIVKEVYKNEVSKNSPDCPNPAEPRLSDFLDYLRIMVDGRHFKSDGVRETAEELLIRLENFRENPWLDAPMDGAYKIPTRLCVYDLNSLKNFEDNIRRSLAYRVAGRVLQSIGSVTGLTAEGAPERTPVFNVIDEMRRIRTDFPEVCAAAEIATRQGGKEGVTTTFIAQAYDDLADIPGIAKNLGTRIIGRQTDNLDSLLEGVHLSEDSIAAVRAINNAHGKHAQFLMVIGSGDNRKAEWIQVTNAAITNWSVTTIAEEVNAIERIQALCPHWRRIEVIAYLADLYPQGMMSAGIQALPEEHLPVLEAA